MTQPTLPMGFEPALRSHILNCVVCEPPCWWTRCAVCGTKLSTHDFTEEESRRYALAEERRNPHDCRPRPRQAPSPRVGRDGWGVTYHPIDTVQTDRT